MYALVRSFSSSLCKFWHIYAVRPLYCVTTALTSPKRPTAQANLVGERRPFANLPKRTVGRLPRETLIKAILRRAFTASARGPQAERPTDVDKRAKPSACRRGRVELAESISVSLERTGRVRRPILPHVRGEKRESGRPSAQRREQAARIFQIPPQTRMAGD